MKLTAGTTKGIRKAPIPVAVATTDVSQPIADLISGDYAINVHSSQDISIYIACGNVGGVPDELKRTVGERVFRSFFPRHLRNHDAEDKANLTEIGQTRHGAVALFVSVRMPFSGSCEISLTQ